MNVDINHILGVSLGNGSQDSSIPSPTTTKAAQKKGWAVFSILIKLFWASLNERAEPVLRSGPSDSNIADIRLAVALDGTCQ